MIFYSICGVRCTIYAKALAGHPLHFSARSRPLE